jgi:hypothetical protein
MLPLYPTDTVSPDMASGPSDMLKKKLVQRLIDNNEPVIDGFPF